ncbi:glycosyltransferase family 2 protein [Flavobacterium sp. TSSA_36]|uniref:glycosyltransferase family 2 protein n=1 Tax=Flavobacterium sp. TSSA_36 TaxID=3447669 RepID=UPI003F2A396E
MNLSVIILAMTTTKELFSMTSNCINSLLDSEQNIDMEILVIESNKEYFRSDFKYPDFVNVIIPDEDFNFHKFLNIGIKASKGDFVALCNNDLIFYKNWFSEILKVQVENPSIKSFSPSGKIDDFAFSRPFEIGYKVRTHIMGWCIVAKREVFSRIGYLDETFDFYFADNDYAMTLKMYDIRHAMVFNSYVKHLEKKSSNSYLNSVSEQNDFLKKYHLPQYLLESEYKWVVENERNLSGFLKFHGKWGSPIIYYRKNKIADLLIKYKLGILNRIVLKLQ